LFLPGKTIALVGPQVNVRSVALELQLHGWPTAAVVVQSVNVGSLSSVLYSISFVVCPEPQAGAVQEASDTLIGSETVVNTRPFFGWRVWPLLMVVGMVCFAVSLGQLPPPPTQAQLRSTVAELVTQMFVLPNPLTSTLTLNGVDPHEKSKTLMACAQALPVRATPELAKTTPAQRANKFLMTSSFYWLCVRRPGVTSTAS
jgi:hypothetical protein